MFIINHVPQFKYQPGYLNLQALQSNKTNKYSASTAYIVKYLVYLWLNIWYISAA